MGCGGCSLAVPGADGKAAGCKSNGGCSSGGCNRLNVFDWLSELPFSAQQDTFKTVEVSFKNGSRKGFYQNVANLDCHTGDTVAVEALTGGYDVGRISLSGELVRLQMKKKRVSKDAELPRLIRLATDRDIERWEQAKRLEYSTMLMARVISRDLELNMKVGDVEYQGDGRKATFYYTAEDRVDFRELIKIFAREFKIKIEMRQIGARQEAGRIGGIGTCGRELCCSTWLTSFKSVSTTAARYQNLAINQAKLSGQCGRLKCCLNYELDSYLDAIKGFPKDVEYLEVTKGKARLVKKDIFKRMMWYSLQGGTGMVGLKLDRVMEIKAMNEKGEKPESLRSMAMIDLDKVIGFEDGVGETSLDLVANIEKKKKRRRRRKNRNNSNTTNSATPKNNNNKKPTNSNASPQKSTANKPQRPKNTTSKSTNRPLKNKSQGGAKTPKKPNQNRPKRTPLNKNTDPTGRTNPKSNAPKSNVPKGKTPTKNNRPPSAKPKPNNKPPNPKRNNRFRNRNNKNNPNKNNNNSNDKPKKED